MKPLNAQYGVVGAPPTANPECLVDALTAFAEGDTLPDDQVEALGGFGMIALDDGHYRLTDEGESWVAELADEGTSDPEPATVVAPIITHSVVSQASA